MATFTKRDGAWRAQVRKKGHPLLSKTFTTKAAAERWARSVEAGIEHGTHLPSKEAEGTTLADLLGRYLEEVSPKKRSGNSDKEISPARLQTFDRENAPSAARL